MNVSVWWFAFFCGMLWLLVSGSQTGEARSTVLSLLPGNVFTRWLVFGFLCAGLLCLGSRGTCDPLFCVASVAWKQASHRAG